MYKLRRFETEAEYSAATLNYPSVSWVVSGDTVHYDKTAPTPTFQGKWLATYFGGTTSSAECDSTSAITENEITKTNLESVEIGNCVTNIGNEAFQHCTSLTSITIGSGVTTIGLGAFIQCSSLASIVIPSGVTSIEAYTFYKCSGLTSITVNATTPPALDYSAFDDTNNCPIYVPSQSVNAYKTANEWSGYASRIQAIQ